MHGEDQLENGSRREAQAWKLRSRFFLGSAFLVAIGFILISLGVVRMVGSENNPRDSAWLLGSGIVMALSSILLIFRKHEEEESRGFFDTWMRCVVIISFYSHFE